MSTQTIVDQTQEVPEGYTSTQKGPVKTELLGIKEFFTPGEEADAIATEYWLDGECVRRDVNLTLKPKEMLGFTQASF